MTDAYDSRVVLLLCRMINLKELTLSLNVHRTTFIDRTHLDEEFLNYMPKLNTFIFHICTSLLTYHGMQMLSTDDIQKTFIDWKYSSISCCVDYLANAVGLCHIYSTPVKINRFMYITNSFRDNHFQFVTNVLFYDTRSFEHDFFQWTSRAFPLLVKLKISNFSQQEKKNKSSLSIIKYLRLNRLDIINAHIDYAYQFLCHTTTYLPYLVTLVIKYDKLIEVTNNFTNDLTRSNCENVNRLCHGEITAYPKDFYQYFPCLPK